MLRAKKQIKTHTNETACKIQSSKNGIVTIIVQEPQESYKTGEKVLVLTSRAVKSASKKNRKISEVVAQGPIETVGDGLITVDTSQSRIVSKRAQNNAIAKKSQVIIRSLD